MRVRILLTTLCAILSVPLPAVAQPIRILDCDLKLENLDATIRCLRRKQANAVDQATAPLNTRITDLQRDLNAITNKSIFGCRLRLTSPSDIAATERCIQNHFDDLANDRIRSFQRELGCNVDLGPSGLDNTTRCVNRRIATEAVRATTPLRREIEELQEQVPVAAEAELLRAVRDLQLDQLMTCLSQTDQSFVNISNRFIRNPVRFAQVEMSRFMTLTSSSIDTLLKTQLELVKDGTLPTPEGLIEQADIFIELLARQDPGMTCVYESLLRPHRQEAKRAARQVYRDIEREARTVLEEEIVPAIQHTVQEQMNDIFVHLSNGGSSSAPLMADLLPSPVDLQRIAQGVAVRHLMRNDIPLMTERVERLVNALEQGQDTEVAVAGIASSANQTWPELIAVEIGVETLRFIGHRYIDSNYIGSGNYLVGLGRSTLGSLHTTAGNLLEAACGLIPEAGAAVCALVKELVDVVFHYLAQQELQRAVIRLLHEGMNSVVDAGWKKVNGEYSAATAREHAGPMGALVDVFPTREALVVIAGDEAKAIETAMLNYNRSVHRLSRRATLMR